jgi:hypothetical protein
MSSSSWRGTGCAPFRCAALAPCSRESSIRVFADRRGLRRGYSGVSTLGYATEDQSRRQRVAGVCVLNKSRSRTRIAGVARNGTSKAASWAANVRKPSGGAVLPIDRLMAMGGQLKALCKAPHCPCRGSRIPFAPTCRVGVLAVAGVVCSAASETRSAQAMMSQIRSSPSIRSSPNGPRPSIVCRRARAFWIRATVLRNIRGRNELPGERASRD